MLTCTLHTCTGVALSVFARALILGKMVHGLAKLQSPRLLKHVVRCYLRLSDNSRAREALRQCLPEPLRDNTFQQCKWCKIKECFRLCISCSLSLPPPSLLPSSPSLPAILRCTPHCTLLISPTYACTLMYALVHTCIRLDGRPIDEEVACKPPPQPCRRCSNCRAGWSKARANAYARTNGRHDGRSTRPSIEHPQNGKAS